MSANPSPLTYTVATFRKHGLEARWSRTRAGAPIILARKPAGLPHQRTTWWAMHGAFWTDAREVGVLEAFDRHTLLGDVFSVPA